MLAEKNEIFERPEAEVIRLSGNAAVRAEYEARQKAIRDKMAEFAFVEERGLAKGREEGLAEGLEKGLARGREEGIILVAKNMKQNGVPFSQIAQYTSLSLEEVEKL